MVSIALHFTNAGEKALDEICAGVTIGIYIAMICPFRFKVGMKSIPAWRLICVNDRSGKDSVGQELITYRENDQPSCCNWPEVASTRSKPLKKQRFLCA